jgi:hypothetical protein
MLLGSPNKVNTSSELIPWRTFIMFSVVNDEGKADIDIVSQDAINKNMNKVEIISSF